jgi:hypothetical protein
VLEAENLTSLISRAVAAKMTPEFIEKEVDARVDKLIVESVDKALRTWSDTGKLIEKAIEDALKVDRIDLPSYGAVVSQMVKAQIEARVAPLVAGRLAEDMDELLKLAPAEIKLSEIAASMLERHEDAYGPAITVIVDHSEYGGATVYLDEDNVYDKRDKYKCEYRLSLLKDGKLFAATLRDCDLKATSYLGGRYGLDQRIRAYYACGTVIILDEDDVVTGRGDY